MYQSACSTWTCVPPVGCRGPSVWRTGDVVDDASDASDIVVIVGTTRTGLSREGPACIHADTWLACGVGSVMMGSAVMTLPPI